MVRKGGEKKEDNAEMEERKRLKKLALKRSIISESQATVSSVLSPSNLVIKHNGKDIVRKSQRSGKNRFLFSFPGLLAPVSSGGKIGELKDLGTKNPVLYLEFPQGQMKLFGTIVFPKNRYLTLQFSRGGKNVTCEDYFDNMIVFSEAWWIGTKDENPNEERLEFPKEFTAKQEEYDFKGGAGATCNGKQVDRVQRKHVAVGPQSPKHEVEDDSSSDDVPISSQVNVEVVTPTRHSARTAGKNIKFAEDSSGDDDNMELDDVETSEGEEHAKNIPEIVKKTDDSTSKSKENAKAPLVQATISTLFKKAGEKIAQVEDGTTKKKAVWVSPRKKAKIVNDDIKSGIESSGSKKATKVNEDDDDIEEFSSSSQDIEESSDGDWEA